MPSTIGALAVGLLALAREAGEGGVLHVASSERRAEELGRILRGLAPDLEIVVFPPWDCLPYDRASPSRDAMGRRMAALHRLIQPQPARIVVTVPDALLQRVPPRAVCRDNGFVLRANDAIDSEELESRLCRIGYLADERVDDPGEIAFRGQVIDIFPPGERRPVRIEHDDGLVQAIRGYDPVSQLTADEVETLRIDPASEVILPGADGADAPDEKAGLEHRLPEIYPSLETLFDYLPAAIVVLEPKAEERRRNAMEHIADAFEARSSLKAERQADRGRTPLPPERLYLTEAEWDGWLKDRGAVRLQAPETDGDASGRVPRFAAERQAQRAFAEFVREAVEAGRRVALAAANERDLKALVTRAEQASGAEAQPARDWSAVVAARAGSLFALRLDLEEGFVDDESNTAVIAAADLLGSRARVEKSARPDAQSFGETELRLGDAVIHMDYGMGVLSGLESVTVADQVPGDAVRLTYKDDDKLLAPVEELDRVWRYGADGDAVSVDRLRGEAWPKRRAEIEAEITQAAQSLVAAAKERDRTEAPKLSPPRREYERFVARFPFTETPDQARAIEDTLRDLASGRPMNRLVCGDVGYGKTEVALRAAAVAAFAGKQVAVLAPTTVLVRQHVRTFRRRFAGTGIEVEHLSRLVKPADVKRVKAGLADGGIRLVIGTHALIGKGVRFEDLGLVVIDEEQRFGAAHKRKLQELAKGIHLLTLTATPVPRTLQAATVGLMDLSLITTPPARRQPIRTFLTPFDPVSVREALLREQRRGGQSFVVCPRIEDIAPLQQRLAEIVPELEVLTAHGKMPVDEIDETMVSFADGEGDVLLATNIIESGLDVPRANTMLVWRPDRFGLAQLHQLRGRVGRGNVRGIAYLLTDPAEEIPAATRKRLETLETLDRLGAGFAISARDLDLRGAGDLMGEEQAGHVKLIGSDLYQHLLARALRVARGEADGEENAPVLNLGIAGRIPDDFVPEPEVRINLYARLAKLGADEPAAALGEEFEDRFGPLPEPVRDLILAAEAKQLCRRLSVARIDAGPQAVALTFQGRRPDEALVEEVRAKMGHPLEWRGERLLLNAAIDSAADRVDAVVELLQELASARRAC